MGVSLDFAGDRTSVRRIDPAGVPELAEGLTVPQRLYSLLLSGPMSRGEIAGELVDILHDTLKKTIGRGLAKGQYVELPDKRISLISRVKS